MSDWIEWKGGERPVDGMVEVRYDTGDVAAGDASGFFWNHLEYDTNVVAYRVIEEFRDTSDIVVDPLSVQVGGSHYKNLKIQPVEYILANNLGFCEGSVIKYVTRHEEKGGVQDLRKAIHFLEILISDIEKRNVPK